MYLVPLMRSPSGGLRSVWPTVVRITASLMTCLASDPSSCVTTPSYILGRKSGVEAHTAPSALPIIMACSTSLVATSCEFM
eukprot:CAMPEP_0184545216 /NCGR_PEP_ID=MMETSP0199_2-20130426/4155_1 /TAXON_ID=1112570 /ORGANISM="Thraustochytrium sp., Strain LLF1b" /LENGTH=80 /DNA_ID=CAMNT_0026939497 /DNA_START=288 /DNA_END=530 /DNA_ORIENTATION=+